MEIDGETVETVADFILGGSGLGTPVHPWLIHVNVWQNQYSIVKQNKVKIKIKKKLKNERIRKLEA